MKKHVIGLMILLSLALVARAGDEEKFDIAKASRENSQEAADALKESGDKPTPEEDKSWKTEARDWLNFDKHKDHKTFKLDPKQAKDWTEGFYKSGAEKVWITNIQYAEFGGPKFELADEIVVVLPKDKDKRAAIFKIWNDSMKEDEEAQLKDVGQAYIFITGD